MKRYAPEIEAEMQAFYHRLSEKDRRRYAAIEAHKLGYGGQSYIAGLLGCDRNPIAVGLAELQDAEAMAQSRIRQVGAGRKACLTQLPQLETTFLQVVEDHTAGSPTNAPIKWTNLTQQQIVQRLAERGMTVSPTVVQPLLDKHHDVRRKAQKRESVESVAERDEQFAKIARLKAKYAATPQPVVECRDEKKELIGNFYRPGRLYTQAVVTTLDHDWPSLASAIVLPPGVYDLKRNHGFVILGTSHDTREFACDSLRWWWHDYGQQDYPAATSWLLLCDGGGSHRTNTWLFKAELAKLGQETGVEVRVAHYPPYTSKYNPIEHRLFPHLTRARPRRELDQCRVG
jgi:hypothetical protein